MRTSALGGADRAQEADLAAPLGDLHEEVVGDVDRADRDDDRARSGRARAGSTKITVANFSPSESSSRRSSVVLEPLREHRELVLVLERDDDRRVGRSPPPRRGTRGSSAAMYWIGIVMPIGIALSLMPTSTASTRRGRCLIVVLLPAIVVRPRPIENRIADRPPRWVTNLTKSVSAIGRPCDFANWPL